MITLQVLAFFVMLLQGCTGLCEPWCSESCCALSGDVTTECDSCEPPLQCRPGAKCYDGKGLSNDVGDSSAGEVGSAAPDAAPDAQEIPADATAERGYFGGHHDRIHNPSLMDKSPAMLAKLRAAANNRPDVVTAGGSAVECEVQRYAWKDIEGRSPSELKKLLTSEPAVITGLIDDWPALAKWANPDAFIEHYGHHSIRSFRTSRGYVLADFHRVSVENTTISIPEVVAHAGNYDQVVIMDTREMGECEADLLQSLSKDYEIPSVLEAISADRLFSYGGAMGVQMSRHSAAWLAVVAGAKLWHMAPPDRPLPQPRSCANRGKIDYELAKQEGVTHCLLLPGEVMVVPDNWWHATCNVLPYTVAMGGQSWDAAVRDGFRPVRPESERRPFGTLRTPTDYQKAVPKVDGLVPLPTQATVKEL